MGTTFVSGIVYSSIVYVMEKFRKSYCRSWYCLERQGDPLACVVANSRLTVPEDFAIFPHKIRIYYASAKEFPRRAIRVLTAFPTASK